MEFSVSQRLSQVKPSATLAITAKAGLLRAQGEDVLGLGAGEPDFDTPDYIKEAAIQAIKDGFTKYTPVGGTPELKQAICQKFEQDNGLIYRPEEIVVSVGGKQALYNLFQAALNPGDEVIIPAPFWVSYPDMVLLAEGKPVIVGTTDQNNFLLTPETLEEAITPKTRFLVINSPSNPTGTAYDKASLMALGEVLKKHPHVWVITDDIYEKLTYDQFAFYTLPQVVPELKERTIVFNGVSKAYSMTGWRIGYAAGPKAVIKAMTTLQSQSTSNPTSISQKAAEAALTGPQDEVEKMRKAFEERKNLLVNGLNSIRGINCRMPNGSFYVYPNVEGMVKTSKRLKKSKLGATSMGLADYLLENHGVAVVPGEAFGLAPFIRISFSTSTANLEDALNRLESASKALAK
ncbi:pyridoxal phosphate-dependent aminotransferase [Magnetococcales bacterium HHB-1]